MKKLDHPYIISLIADINSSDYMYLVMEIVTGGDLFDAITRVTRFSESQSKIMIKHLGLALAYLHSKGIVHRDIKPENLLVSTYFKKKLNLNKKKKKSLFHQKVEMDENGSVTLLKLGDFGLACEVTEPLFAVCGTPTYVAPEILMETGYGLKVSFWFFNYLYIF
jgi:doublecortin-like kinase 1/2